MTNLMTDQELRVLDERRRVLRDLQQFVLDASAKFSNIKTNLYATSVPLDDSLLAERTSAVEGLLENLTYMLEHIEHGTISPVAF